MKEPRERKSKVHTALVSYLHVELEARFWWAGILEVLGT